VRYFDWEAFLWINSMSEDQIAAETIDHIRKGHEPNCECNDCQAMQEATEAARQRVLDELKATEGCDDRRS
jgi:hypothetical protein